MLHRPLSWPVAIEILPFLQGNGIRWGLQHSCTDLRSMFSQKNLIIDDSVIVGAFINACSGIRDADMLLISSRRVCSACNCHT